MNRVVGSIVVFVTLLFFTGMTSHAWYYYANAEDIVWEEIPVENETLSAGTIISALPNGARSVSIERVQYFISGANWFLPVISEEGIKYQVVFAPI